MYAALNASPLCAPLTTQQFHSQLLANLRESFRVLPGPMIAVALDLKGPEVRTGGLTTREVWLRFLS